MRRHVTSVIQGTVFMESCGSTFNKKGEKIMEKRGEEIKELLTHIMNKLERLEQKTGRRYKNLSCK
jgi:hypothetical protein